MKKYILIFAVILSFTCPYFAQNRIGVNAGYGYYAGNSENSAPITDGHKFRSHILYGLTLQKEDLFGLNLMLDYSYHQITKDNVFNVTTYPDGEHQGPTIGGDVKLVSHNFDLAYVGAISRYLSYGAGPSFVIVNRIFELDAPVTTGSSQASLDDKLASSHLGVNGFLMFTMPLGEGSGFFVSSKLKLRYSHSIWFDEGPRDLRDYYQSFTTTQLTLGVGYSF
ncbi:MAG: hypothetical protein HF314_15070 [Ignavibacteria bacterium]|jgi:hypothetical protein|nr:hypothetical protein [Ignavibacteria bacterium]MCU7504402.1 hypothetical protein [Ignavibacteria bacterium]MCU7518157.1 hypothetical protein [Ignavibacteria bacterium]